MKDFDAVVDATRQLTQVWKAYRDGLDNKRLPTDIFEKLCAIDESVGNIIENVTLLS